MDTKSLAKSKRAHTLHHKKHHPNQKVKNATASVGPTGTDKAPGKVVKEKPQVSQGPTALPSNWDRYDDEDDSITESQTDGQSSQPSDVVVPKSKGADYAYLISEAKSQNSTRFSSEIFPSFDDFVSDFGQGKDSFFAVRGESLLSSIKSDSFFVEDKSPANYEASFLSLNLHALSEQLAKIDLPKRLFMEADMFPQEMHSEKGQEPQNSSQDRYNANRNESQTNDRQEVEPSNTAKSHHLAAQNHTSCTTMNPMVQPTPDSNPKSSENQSKVKAQTADDELDMLLDSFADTNLKENGSTSNKKTIDFDIDGTLDDLLNETSTPIGFVSPSQPVSKSEQIDDFDSWLDTI